MSVERHLGEITFGKLMQRFLSEAGAEDATQSRRLFGLKPNQPAFTRKDEHAVLKLLVLVTLL